MHFVRNPRIYEEINPEVSEIIKDFIDFNTFKQTMKQWHYHSIFPAKAALPYWYEEIGSIFFHTLDREPLDNNMWRERTNMTNPFTGFSTIVSARPVLDGTDLHYGRIETRYPGKQLGEFKHLLEILCHGRMVFA